MRLSIFRQSWQELQRPGLRWTFMLVIASGLLLLAYLLLKMIVDLNWLGLQGSASFLFGSVEQVLELSQPGIWLQAAGFGLVFPLLLAVYAIGQGAWLVAGEEERGSLGLLLAAPLTRTRFLLEKSAVLFVAVLRPVLGLWIFLIVVRWLRISPAGSANLELALLGLFLLALVFGAIAFALGCLTGRQRFSLLVSAGLLVLFFLLGRLPAAQAAQSVLRLFTPFTPYQALIYGGDEPVRALLALLVTLLVSLACAWVLFEQRDLQI